MKPEPKLESTDKPRKRKTPPVVVVKMKRITKLQRYALFAVFSLYLASGPALHAIGSAFATSNEGKAFLDRHQTTGKVVLTAEEDFLTVLERASLQDAMYVR